MKRSFYLVVGLGKTGHSIARYLQRHHHPFALFDTRKNPPLLDEFKQDFPTIPVYLEELPKAFMDKVTDIIASPGVSLDTPLFQEAKHQGVAIYGDIECLARATRTPMIAITGTNGKSTVTTLVGEMAKAAGFCVAVAGNIGNPVLDLLDDEHQYDLWVLELSSFQLDLTHTLAPHAATILNITPDHLDRHHSLDAYIQAKQRIYNNAQSVLYNREDLQTIPQINAASNHVCSFGEDSPTEGNWGLIKKDGQIFLAKGSDALVLVDSLKIKGVHNWLNALAAAALADAFGISKEAIIDVLKTFAGLPHRCQWIRTLDGVDWINDSKGTNVGATISAINGIGGSMQGKIVLIAGGQGKGADFEDLSASVSDYVRSMVLLGEDADKMEHALSHRVPITRASTLEEAVLCAKEQAKAGDVVLLSPACASLDMFRDFNHRGDVFASSVNGL